LEVSHAAYFIRRTGLGDQPVHDAFGKEKVELLAPKPEPGFDKRSVRGS
jgi:hypothetical protein